MLLKLCETVPGGEESDPLCELNNDALFIDQDHNNTLNLHGELFLFDRFLDEDFV